MGRTDPTTKSAGVVVRPSIGCAPVAPKKPAETCAPSTFDVSDVASAARSNVWTEYVSAGGVVYVVGPEDPEHPATMGNSSEMRQRKAELRFIVRPSRSTDLLSVRDNRVHRIVGGSRERQ